MTQLRFNVFFLKCDLGLDSTKGKRLIYGHAKKRKRPEMHGNNRFKKGKKTQENSSKPSQTSNPLNPRLRLNQKA